MESINYTFIIPHKNIPDLLQRCLNSIPRREDIQIIVVDDNSDPEKVDFEHFPGVGEPCVEVYFTKEGKGAGYARNVGLKHAKGKWLLFADADDFYNRSFLHTLDSYKDDSCLDVLYFSVNSVDSDTLQCSDRSIEISTLLDSYKPDSETWNDLLRYTLWVPWNKMFRREFIVTNGIFFDEILSGNDAFFVVRAGHLAENIEVDRNKLYCVTYRKSSLTYFPNVLTYYSSFEMRLRLNLFYKSIGKEDMCVLLYGTIWGTYKIFGLREALRLVFMVAKYKQFNLFVKQIFNRLIG